MNGLHDTPAMKDSAKYADVEYTMAIIPPNFGTHVAGHGFVQKTPAVRVRHGG